MCFSGCDESLVCPGGTILNAFDASRDSVPRREEKLPAKCRNFSEWARGACLRVDAAAADSPISPTFQALSRYDAIPGGSDHGKWKWKMVNRLRVYIYHF